MTIFNRRRKADSVATRKSKRAEVVKATQDVRQVTRENPAGFTRMAKVRTYSQLVLS